MNIKIVSNKFNEDVYWIENSKYDSLNNNFNDPLIYIHKNKDWISHVSCL